MRIILIGCGVVGQGFAQLLLRRKAELAKTYCFRPRIVAVVDRGGAAISSKGLDLEEMLSLKVRKGTVAASLENGHYAMSASDVIESVEAEAVVEATHANIKDGEPGLSHIKAALKTGRHVVTTNKGPLALALSSLTEIAHCNNVYLKFSGTVGAGTPVLELAKRCLFGDRIVSMKGILNGTTNYILTEMDEKRVTLKQALKKPGNLDMLKGTLQWTLTG